MNIEFETNKYAVVKNVLSEDLKGVIANYVQTKFYILKDYTMQGGVLDDADVVQPYSRYRYSDTLTESLLAYLTSKVSKVVNKQLCPSYSFLRYYENGQWLRKHHDRPSCQYSVTLPLFVDVENEEPWEIYMEDTPVKLSVGDMVVYKGIAIDHWRPPYEGKFQVQAHLHYVDANEVSYKPYHYDGRCSLGIQKND
jgi:hypothetical protein